MSYIFNQMSYLLFSFLGHRWLNKFWDSVKVLLLIYDTPSDKYVQYSKKYWLMTENFVNANLVTFGF